MARPRIRSGLPPASLLMPELYMNLDALDPKAPSKSKPGGSHKFPKWHETEHMGNLAGRRSAGITRLVAKGNDDLHSINDYGKKRSP